ncbi:MAG TPA: 2-amino-4-hydroxy-6-hydroxymethyldihydropteridine diphosphokinase [Flavobacteriales bacterium]|nr:2-amino-4-hydroxy-6-hydroxymethyldihydropteridine diphosphokinase [Flavobacteriales bacterium]
MPDERDMLLLLGGNIGDPPGTLGKAADLLNERAGRVIAWSRDHWTEPWGFTDARLFLNRALVLRTTSTPEAVLRIALDIERELGRVRSEEAGYASRTIDIDILLVGDDIISAPTLVVPHPRMHERWFALAPAADVAPSWRHPLLGRSVLGLLNDLRRRR